MPVTGASQLAYSPDEVLMKKDLGAMSAKETEHARRLITELISVLANYRSRRLVSDKKGVELNFRKMLRRNVLYGNDNVELLYRRRRIKKTRLMLLCDVSGSMECYSSFLIYFICALHQQLTNPEIAVFSTRMTVISEFLKTRTVEDSLNQVTEIVHDWAGGTNIGSCLREFNDRFAYDMMRSRTVVIILSDGWDRGDASEMRARDGASASKGAQDSVVEPTASRHQLPAAVPGYPHCLAFYRLFSARPQPRKSRKGSTPT